MLSSMDCVLNASWRSSFAGYRVFHRSQTSEPLEFLVILLPVQQDNILNWRLQIGPWMLRLFQNMITVFEISFIPSNRYSVVIVS